MLGRFNSFGNWKMKTHFLSAREMTGVSEGVNSCLAYASRYEANGLLGVGCSGLAALSPLAASIWIGQRTDDCRRLLVLSFWDLACPCTPKALNRRLFPVPFIRQSRHWKQHHTRFKQTVAGSGPLPLHIPCPWRPWRAGKPDALRGTRPETGPCVEPAPSGVLCPRPTEQLSSPGRAYVGACNTGEGGSPPH